MPVAGVAVSGGRDRARGPVDLAWRHRRRSSGRSGRGRPGEEWEHPRLHNLVDGLCATMGLPRPAILVVDSPVPNAMAVGRDPRSAPLVVTSGPRHRTEPGRAGGRPGPRAGPHQTARHRALRGGGGSGGAGRPGVRRRDGGDRWCTVWSGRAVSSRPTSGPPRGALPGGPGLGPRVMTAPGGQPAPWPPGASRRSAAHPLAVDRPDRGSGVGTPAEGNSTTPRYGPPPWLCADARRR